VAERDVEIHHPQTARDQDDIRAILLAGSANTLLHWRTASEGGPYKRKKKQGLPAER